MQSGSQILIFVNMSCVLMKLKLTCLVIMTFAKFVMELIMS